MSDEDRELLESIAVEVAGELRACGLIGAENVTLATIPVPAIEIEYAGYVVTLEMDIYRHLSEE